MKVYRSATELQRACTMARGAGASVGFVPTMGALHAGHLSLVESLAPAPGSFRVVSIFVNPLQFGAGEDLEEYPRPIERDLELCREHGVDAVFTPGHGELYPEGFQTSVRVGGLTDILEGERRPGHFDGVTTVVAKLLSIVGPCRAVFGRKDYQQLAVVRKMVSDLNMQVCIAEHPIVRELDGLALSSRNRYLSPEERQRALCLSQGIRAARDLWAKGERETVLLEEAAMVPVRAGADRVDYVTVRDALTLERVPSFSDSEPVLLLAAFVGKTRLIDNSVLCAADYS